MDAEEQDPEASPRRGISRFADIRFVEPDAHEQDEPSSRQRRRNGRVLAAVVAVAGALALALAVVGVIAVRHYLDDASSVTERMALKYHAQYRACVEDGRDRARCAATAETACAADGVWVGDSHSVDDIRRACRFGDS